MGGGDVNFDDLVKITGENRREDRESCAKDEADVQKLEEKALIRI